MTRLWTAILVTAIGLPARAAELPADFDRGVNHAHVHRGDRGYGSLVSRAEMEALKSIGINAVSLTPFGYQQSFDADEVRFGGDRSMSDEHLRAEADNAHAIGLKVALKPHIWSRDFGGGNQWHGTIDQPNAASHARWWASYREMALHYARLAHEAKIETYCLGTELVQMTTKYPDDWIALIDDVRKVYTGRVTYAAHWDREVAAIAFWNKLDAIGVSAYYPLDVPVGATVEQLAGAWKPHIDRLDKLHERFRKPIVFMEAGYRPVNDCHQKPWLYDGGELDPDAQARAYDAMFTALGHKPWWRGAYLWKTFTDPRAGSRGGGTRSFSFRDLPAEQVLRRWFLSPAAAAP